MDIRPIVLGTAGHIDHGKSTLVQALTGVDPDRLREEKERGLTIDLGFAPLELADGRWVGIVDVPGHERFIKNMVAGATGIDFAILVVAADDGVMPQTREHLDIMGVLGLAHGLVALTKIDLVDDEMALLAAEDVRDALRGTFLEGAPILPVSARTGAGLAELRAALSAAAARVPARSAEGVFRMPVQRVFSAAGFGTVVTGIPTSGALSLGSVLEVVPGGLRGKVRGIQAYGQPSESARAGHSTAINLSDVERGAVRRGSVVAEPGFFRAVPFFAARLRALPSLARAIPDRAHVRIHIGTDEVQGELVLLDKPALEPGEQGLVQVRLREGAVCAPGDAFVARLASPLVTLGGGVVVEESRHRLKRFKAFVLDELARQERSLGSPGELACTLLFRAGLEAQTSAALAVDLKRPQAEVRDLCAELAAAGRIRPFGPDRWMHAERFEEGAAELVAAVEAWFAEHAHRAFAPALDLRQALGWDAARLSGFLEELVRAGQLAQEPGGRVLLPGRQGELDPEARALAQAALAALAAGGFQPPSAAELAPLVRASPARLAPVLEHLADQGLVAAIVPGELYLTRERIEQAESAIAANCRAHGALEIPALRDALGTSRKYLIPLLEFFDARGLTLRQGGRRVLKAR